MYSIISICVFSKYARKGHSSDFLFAHLILSPNSCRLCQLKCSNFPNAKWSYTLYQNKYESSADSHMIFHILIVYSAFLMHIFACI